LGGTGGDLGTLGGRYTKAEALNNAGVVVGWSTTSGGAQHAMLYSNGIMEDLNKLLPPTSGLTLTDAVGIDASGRIVAYGTDSSGATHEVLLTPEAVPEPTTLAMFGLVGIAFGARRLVIGRRKTSRTLAS
jgi:probable HAF family extracellular repeat protein